jgi:predicted DNA-binding transcriptional regulator AlpA
LSHYFAFNLPDLLFIETPNAEALGDKESLKMNQPKRYLTTRKVMARHCISKRTLERRLKDATLDFPKPVMIQACCDD